MSIRSFTWLAAIGAGAILLLFSSTTILPRTGSGAATDREEARALPREIDPYLPIIPIGPPL